MALDKKEEKLDCAKLCNYKACVDDCITYYSLVHVVVHVVMCGYMLYMLWFSFILGSLGLNFIFLCLGYGYDNEFETMEDKI